MNHLLKFHSFLNKLCLPVARLSCLSCGTRQPPTKKPTSLRQQPPILWKLFQTTKNALWFTQALTLNSNFTITEQWPTPFRKPSLLTQLCTQVLTLQLPKSTSMTLVPVSESTTIFTVVWKISEQQLKTLCQQLSQLWPTLFSVLTSQSLLLTTRFWLTLQAHLPTLVHTQSTEMRLTIQPKVFGKMVRTSSFSPRKKQQQQANGVLLSNSTNLSTLPSPKVSVAIWQAKQQESQQSLSVQNWWKCLFMANYQLMLRNHFTSPKPLTTIPKKSKTSFWLMPLKMTSMKSQWQMIFCTLGTLKHKLKNTLGTWWWVKYW